MYREDNDKYIDYLDEDGWHLVLSDEYKNRKRSLIKTLSLFMMVIVFLCFTCPITYSKFVSETASTASIDVAKWSFKIDTKKSDGVSINLVDTLVNNSYSTTHVIPGTMGVINFDIDFSDSLVASIYKIEVDREKSNIPSNLKFYVDEARTIEMIDYQEKVSLEDIDKVISKNVYWKWVFTEDDETDDWSNKDITLVLKVTGQQDVENDIENGSVSSISS